MIQGRTDRGVLIAVIVVATIPFLAGTVSAWTSDDTPTSHDVALIELRTSDVGSETPLVGSFQRYGGNQPGPLVFYSLALPYRLTGGTLAGLQLGTLAVAWVSVVGILVIAQRRGGVPLLLWSFLLIEILLLSRSAGVLSDPWEPHLTLLPFALLVFVAWELSIGTIYALPFAAAIATFLLQAWISLSVFTAALVTWGVVALGAGIWARRKSRWPEDRAQLIHSTLLAIGVSAVLWLPPVVEQLTTDPGNFSELARLTDRSGDAIGIVDGYRASSIQFDLWAPWLGEAIPLAPLTGTVSFNAGGPLPFALIALLAGAALAWRRRAREAALLSATVVVVTMAAFVSMGLVLDALFVWIFEPTRVVGMMCWLAAGWALYSAIPVLQSKRVRNVIVWVLAAASIVAAAGLAVTEGTHQRETTRLRGAVTRLAERTVESIEDHQEPVLVRSEAQANVIFGGQQFGQAELALLLERDGVETVVPAQDETRFGPHRAEPERAKSEIVLVSGDAIDRFNNDKLFELLALEDPLTPTERHDREQLEHDIRKAAGGDFELYELFDLADDNPELERLLDELPDAPDQPVVAAFIREIS